MLRLALASMVLLPVLAIPARAWAGAGGTLDRDAEYRYADGFYLSWITGDGRCAGAEFCFRLADAAHRQPLLAGVLSPAQPEALAGGGSRSPLQTRTLAQVSVPEPSGRVLAQQDGNDGAWFIYDLAHARYLLDGATHDAAFAKWTELGLQPPRFEVASQGVKSLPETLRSQCEDDALLIVLCGFALLVAAAVAALRLRRRSART